VSFRIQPVNLIDLMQYMDFGDNCHGRNVGNFLLPLSLAASLSCPSARTQRRIVHLHAVGIVLPSYWLGIEVQHAVLVCRQLDQLYADLSALLPPIRYKRSCDLLHTSFSSQQIELRSRIPSVLYFEPYAHVVDMLPRRWGQRDGARTGANDKNICRHDQ